MEVAAETVQPIWPQIVIYGLPTIDTLNENSGIYSPTTSAIRRTPNNTHESVSGHFLCQGRVVVEAMGKHREENYKTDFEIAHKNSKLQRDRNNIEIIWPPLDSNPVGEKTSDEKTPAIDSSARKEKPRKKYAPEDHNSDPNSSDSPSSNSDSSDDRKYKHGRLENNNKYRKRKKQDPIKLCAKLMAKLLTTAYKSDIIKFKLDEDPLQRRIYFLTLVESLEMIFPSIKKIVKYY